MLLDTTGAVDIRRGRLVAPLVLIVLGATILTDGGALACSARLRDDRDNRDNRDNRDDRDKRDDRDDVRPRGRRRSRSGGLWLIGVGAWMLISQLHLWGLGYGNSWPLFIVLSGLMLVIRGWR